MVDQVIVKAEGMGAKLVKLQVHEMKSIWK